MYTIKLYYSLDQLHLLFSYENVSFCCDIKRGSLLCIIQIIRIVVGSNGNLKIPFGPSEVLNLLEL